MAQTLEAGHAANRFCIDQTGDAHVNGSTVWVDGSGDVAFTNIATGLTALSGGGQTGATPLTGKYNVVSTVAAAGDSVQLPATVPGQSVVVTNAAATNSMNVFGQTGDAINAGAANAAYAVTAGKTAILTRVSATQWYAISGT